MHTIHIPLEASLVSLLASTAEAVHKAKIDYSAKSGLFLEEVAASYQGTKKHFGKMCLVYGIRRITRV